MLSTPGPEEQGLVFNLGPGQPSSRVQNPPIPAPATESGRWPVYIESINLIVPSAVTASEEGLDACVMSR